MNRIDRVLSTYRDLRKVADDFAGGLTDAGELHSAVVDYTDSLLGMTVTYGSTGAIVRVRDGRAIEQSRQRS